MARPWIVVLTSAMFLAPLIVRTEEKTKDSPEVRALAYLTREVPRWSVDNQCYSCHNNGDAARALYVAHRLEYKVPDRALEDTSRWLAKPMQWDKNGGEQYSDKALARLQFAAALIDAMDAGLVKDAEALRQASALVAEGQHKDGSWPVDKSDSIGSPTTHGAALATGQARRVLLRTDEKTYRTAIARADQWLRRVAVKTVLDAAAVLRALEGADDKDAKTQWANCLALIRKGQAKDGGWGPYVTAGPEVFDTAVVVLALSTQAEGDDRDRLKRGRAYLVATQQKDGSWAETTRPSGAESYAQRLSTSGWATLALLATAK
ncbi:MAG: hypothetical protein K2R98_30775 [Gemmataceae bacterium]|nr:hypothetical protein [Gemmataceae bacterium]